MSDSEVEFIGESSWAEIDAAKRKRAVELEPETPNKRLLKELNSLAAEAQKQAAGDTTWLARIEQARAALNTAAASHGEAAAAASDAEQIAEAKETEAARAEAEAARARAAAGAAAEAAEAARSRAQAADTAERAAARAMEGAALGTPKPGSAFRPGPRRKIFGRFIMVSREEKAELDRLRASLRETTEIAKRMCALVGPLLDSLDSQTASAAASGRVEES